MIYDAGKAVPMYEVDLNCDLGESFGNYKFGQDEKLMQYISSANIACGFHAGDPGVMEHTVAAAIKHRVAIGAHPGFMDLQGFGRRNIEMNVKEVYQLIIYQLGALAAFTKIAGTSIRHVKPHGALYNMAAVDIRLAEAIATAVTDFDSSLILYGLAGSALIEAGRAKGLPVAEEVFADRTYIADGTLMPRSSETAHITNVHEAAARAVIMVKEGTVLAEENIRETVTGEETTGGTVVAEDNTRVTSKGEKNTRVIITGEENTREIIKTEEIIKQRIIASDKRMIKVKADTICIHGDKPEAVLFAQTIAEALKTAGITIKSPGNAFNHS